MVIEKDPRILRERHLYAKLESGTVKAIMESYLGKKNCNSNAQFKYFEAEDIPDILMHSISGQNTIKNRPISRNKSLEDLKKPGLKFNMLPEGNVLSLDMSGLNNINNSDGQNEDFSEGNKNDRILGHLEQKISQKGGNSIRPILGQLDQILSDTKFDKGGPKEFGIFPSTISQKNEISPENGRETSENNMPLSPPFEKSDIKVIKMSEKPDKLSKIEPKKLPKLILEDNLSDEKCEDRMLKINSPDKFLDLGPPLELKKPCDMDQIPQEPENRRLVGPKRFSDLKASYKQSTLVRFPDHGFVKVQSDVGTSGMQAKKVVQRRRKKKEVLSVDAKQRTIKDFFKSNENSSKSLAGKRKKDYTENIQNKKFKVGSSDYSPVGETSFESS